MPTGKLKNIICPYCSAKLKQNGTIECGCGWKAVIVPRELLPRLRLIAEWSLVQDKNGNPLLIYSATKYPEDSMRIYSMNGIHYLEIIDGGSQ